MIAPEHRSVCVLFDESGEIVHTHEVITLPGGRRVPQDEVEARAIERAKKRGRDVAGLHVLHVPPEKIVAGQRYTVDPATRELKLMPQPEWMSKLPGVPSRGPGTT